MKEPITRRFVMCRETRHYKPQQGIALQIFHVSFFMNFCQCFINCHAVLSRAQNQDLDSAIQVSELTKSVGSR